MNASWLGPAMLALATAFNSLGAPPRLTNLRSSVSLSLPLPCGTPSPNATRASSAPACCRRCGAAGERKAPAKRRRTDANHHD